MSALLLLFRIAWRSLGRNLRRTLITGAGIAVGVGMCIASLGLMKGLDADLLRSVTDMDLGHIQIHNADYLKRRALRLTMPDGSRLVSEVEHVGGVLAVAPRVYGWAFASSGSESTGAQLMGIDPIREPKVTRLHEKVIEGAYLPPDATPWATGQTLSAAQAKRDDEITQEVTRAALAELDTLGGSGPAAVSDAPALRAETQRLNTVVAPPPKAPPPIVLGVKLAQKLHLAVGNTVSLLGQDVQGNPVDVEFKVVGMFRTGTDVIDRSRALVHIADLQHLFVLGDQVHELAIRTGAPDDASKTAEVLRGSAALHTYAVQSWSELRPDVLAMMGANDAMMGMLVFIVFAIAGIGVVNTMLMAVFERKREMGVLKAVGMRPASLVGMVMIETVMLAGFSSLAGMAMGLALDSYLATLGWNLSGSLGKFSLGGVGFDPILHAAPTPEGVALPVVVMVVMALLGSIFPALSAARIEPAVGMREL